MSSVESFPVGAATLRAGPVMIDLSSRCVWVDGRLQQLTAKEFDLVAYLVARPGQVFSRDELLRAVWHSTAEWQQPATVTEHVRRLRAKIEIEPHRPRILRTVRGAGYRLDVPEETRSSPNGFLGDEAEITTRLLKELLRIRSASDAAELLHATIRQLGGRLVFAPLTSAETLDVSLGQGPPLFVTPDRSTVDAVALHRLIAGFTDDAQHAVDLIG